MFTMKPTAVLSLIVLMTSLLFAQNKSEEELFRRAGYNYKHYQLASSLDLDVNNYNVYRLRKKENIKGSVMIGVGSGFICSGFVYIMAGSLYEETDSYYYDTDGAAAVYTATGIITATGGTIALIVGAIKKGQANSMSIIKKDGAPFAWDLAPQIDPIHKKYGMQLSLAF